MALVRESLIHDQGGPAPGPPWFEDPVKLVQAALNVAARDREALRALLHGVARLAAKDESVRRRLADDLKNLPKQTGNVRKAGSALLLHWVNDHREIFGFTVDESLRKLIAAFPDTFPDNVSALRLRYYGMVRRRSK